MALSNALGMYENGAKRVERGVGPASLARVSARHGVGRMPAARPQPKVIMSLALDRTVALIVGAAAIIAACGDSTTDPTPTELSVGGTYTTAVTLQQNGCTGVTIQTFPTTVAHTAGSTTLTVTHAGNSYTGTVQRNGTFVTTPKALGPATDTHTLTIAGTFSTTAIDATVTAVVQRPGSANCQYTVKWAGPKQGAPNVIPG